jgi:glycosyltransferase involved in cell wall biosynthesis
MHNQTNLLFIGGYYPPPLKECFVKNSKIGLDLAANNLQEAIFKGFDENMIDYHIINAPFLGSFPPFFKTPFIPMYKSSDGKVTSISYINVTYIKRQSIKSKIFNEICRWCDVNSENFLLFYNSSCIGLARKIKKIYPKLKICLLVTDLQEFAIVDNSFLTKLNLKINSYKKKTNLYHNYIDGYILLASKMSERLPIGNKPWIQIEGIYNTIENIDEEIPKEYNKTILYTGNLGIRYGIIDLLNAFSKIRDPNYRLWFCGSGNGLDDILQYQKNDNRIKYLGVLPRKKILELQKKATILINPRHSMEEYTKYSFPSKTMEYMASGTPTVMCRLACLPPEYEEHLYFFDDESVEGMKNKIIEICERDPKELYDFGKKAFDFIHRNKIPKMQCKKIYDFLKSL